MRAYGYGPDDRRRSNAAYIHTADFRPSHAHCVMEYPSPQYLERPIAEVRETRDVPRYGTTVDGYSKRSGAPTSRMIRLAGEKRFRRVMVWQFSNAGTAFVRIKGECFIVRDYGEHWPPLCSICRRHHDRSVTHAAE